MQNTGLVIEGGGMRGIYAAGVLDVFLEHNLTFDGVLGVSAGAIHGCSYVAGQHGRSIRYYKKYCADERFMGFKSFLKTGNIVGTQFCYHDIPDKLDPFDHETFEKTATRFYVTCSNLETGRPEYFQITDMRSQIDLLRASASLPYFSQIVEAAGKKLLDGGCTDSIPVRAFQKMGYRKNVVILTQHDGYVKKPQNKALARLFYHKYPRFAKALERRHLIYNRTLEWIGRQEEGRLFVIRPSEPLVIGRLSKDPEKIQQVYDIGRRDALEQLEALKTWLC